MKYYSDKTNKFYDTQELCLEAEKKFDEEKNDKSKLKKEISKKIEEANKNIDEAYRKYDEAKKEASIIINEAKEKARKLISSAEDEIRSYQKEKEEAVREFNSKFGSYMVTYTGDDARKELNRSIRLFDSIFNNFWRF